MKPLTPYQADLARKAMRYGHADITEDETPGFDQVDKEIVQAGVTRWLRVGLPCLVILAIIAGFIIWR